MFPLSFLISRHEETKPLPHFRFTLDAGTSKISQTLSLATCHIHHFPSASESSTGEQSRKASWEHTRADGNCCYCTSLCSDLKRKTTLFCLEDISCVHDNTRHFCHRRIIKLTTPLHSYWFFSRRTAREPPTAGRKNPPGTRLQRFHNFPSRLFEEAHAGPRVTLASLT